jgi:hypothetical protein
MSPCARRCRRCWPRTSGSKRAWPTRPRRAIPAAHRHRAIRGRASARAANAGAAASSPAGHSGTGGRRSIWWPPPRTWSTNAPPCAAPVRRRWTRRRRWPAMSGARCPSGPPSVCWCANTGRGASGARAASTSAWAASRPRRPAGHRTVPRCGRWRSRWWSSSSSPPRAWRIASACASRWGRSPAPVAQGAETVRPVEEQIKAALTRALVLHRAATGVRRP